MVALSTVVSPNVIRTAFSPPLNVRMGTFIDVDFSAMAIVLLPGAAYGIQTLSASPITTRFRLRADCTVIRRVWFVNGDTMSIVPFLIANCHCFGSRKG